MKTSLRFVCMAAVFVAMTFLAPAPRASDCGNVSTGSIPLTDLGAGFYLGAQGGLYAAGGNARPAPHAAAGLAIANAIAPRDTLGQPDPNGKVVLISIGMSNCTQEFSAFVPKALADPARSADVLPVDCAQGGQTAAVIRNPNAPFWANVAQRLRAAGSAPLQAQVVWLKEANAGPTGDFQTSAGQLQNDLAAVVRVIHQKLPNVKICYLTSRIYAGYASTTLNPEPYAYESGFAVKWLIGDQINGVDSLNFDPDEGAVQAPWITWGPYLWADGLSPRSDGLTWACNAFANDGTHPSTIGRNVVADSLLAFFKSDETAVPWFVGKTVSVVETGPGQSALFAAPNPARSTVEVRFASARGDPWGIDVLDLAGRNVRSLGSGIGTGVAAIANWDGRDRLGRRAAPGVYFIRLASGAAIETRRLVLLGQ